MPHIYARESEMETLREDVPAHTSAAVKPLPPFAVNVMKYRNTITPRKKCSGAGAVANSSG